MSRITHRRSGIHRRDSIDEESIALELTSEGYSFTEEEDSENDWDDCSDYMEDEHDAYGSSEETHGTSLEDSIAGDSQDQIEKLNDMHQGWSHPQDETPLFQREDTHGGTKAVVPVTLRLDLSIKVKNEEDTSLLAASPSTPLFNNEPLQPAIAQHSVSGLTKEDKEASCAKLNGSKKTQSTSSCQSDNTFSSALEQKVASHVHPGDCTASTSTVPKPTAASSLQNSRASSRVSARSNHISKMPKLLTPHSIFVSKYSHLPAYAGHGYPLSDRGVLQRPVPTANGIFTAKMHSQFYANMATGQTDHERPIRKGVFTFPKPVNTTANGIFTSRKIVAAAVNAMIQTKPAQTHDVATQATPENTIVKQPRWNIRRNSQHGSPSNINKVWHDFALKECAVKTAKVPIVTTTTSQSQISDPAMPSPICTERSRSYEQTIVEQTLNVTEPTSYLGDTAHDSIEPTPCVYESKSFVTKPTPQVTEPLSDVIVTPSANEPISSVDEPIASVNEFTSCVTERSVTDNEPNLNVNYSTSNVSENTLPSLNDNVKSPASDRANASWCLPLDDEAVMLERWNRFLQSKEQDIKSTEASSNGTIVNGGATDKQDTETVKNSNSAESVALSSTSFNSLSSSLAIGHQPYESAQQSGEEKPSHDISPSNCIADIHDDEVDYDAKHQQIPASTEEETRTLEEDITKDGSDKTTTIEVIKKEEVFSWVKEPVISDSKDKQVIMFEERRLSTSWFSDPMTLLEITNEPWWETPKPAVTEPTAISDTAENVMELKQNANNIATAQDSQSWPITDYDQGTSDTQILPKITTEIEKAEHTEDQPSELQCLNVHNIPNMTTRMTDTTSTKPLDTTDIQEAPLANDDNSEAKLITDTTEVTDTPLAMTAAAMLLPSAPATTGTLKNVNPLVTPAHSATAADDRIAWFKAHVGAPSFVPRGNTLNNNSTTTATNITMNDHESSPPQNEVTDPNILSLYRPDMTPYSYYADDDYDSDSDLEIILESDESEWAQEPVMGMKPSDYRTPLSSNVYPTSSTRISNRSSRSHTPPAASNYHYDSTMNNYYYQEPPNHYQQSPNHYHQPMSRYFQRQQIPGRIVPELSTPQYTTVSYEINGMVYYDYWF